MNISDYGINYLGWQSLLHYTITYISNILDNKGEINFIKNFLKFVFVHR